MVSLHFRVLAVHGRCVSRSAETARVLTPPKPWRNRCGSRLCTAKRAHGQRAAGHASEGPCDQPRPAPLRHVRRDRRRAGSGALVLPRRRRRRARSPRACPPTTWRSATPSTASASATSAAQRLEAMLDYEHAAEPRAGCARRRGDTTAFFAFADTVSARNFQGHQRVPRLDGRPVPGPPARPGQPDHPPRAHARHRERPAAGGAGHRRREPALRRVLPAPRARAARRVAARQPHARSASRST